MTLWADRRGGCAVEFALLAPLFLLMLVGVVEFCRAFWMLTAMQYAVDDVARAAAVQGVGDPAVIAAYAAGELAALTAAPVTFTATVTASLVTVDATYSFSFLTSWPKSLGPVAMTVSSAFPK